MIYNFNPKDKYRSEFLEVLTIRGIDYELTEHDSSVIRILGDLDRETVTTLNDIYQQRGLVTIKRKGESCYTPFIAKNQLPIIAGPCSVESEEQLEKIVKFLKKFNIHYLRGGAYKPRTSCDSFQGLGEPGLKLLKKYAQANNMFVVTEVMDRSQIDTVATYADILQVGSRNMFNYTLLTALGSIRKPILLKRGMAATISEWLQSAQYISRGGNNQIILCERGIRTFEPQTSHTLDLAAITLAHLQSDYPVIADTSHASGRPDLVIPLAAGAVAAGANGVMVEIHPEPDSALSDGKQALTFDQFENFHHKINAVFQACKE